jgi:hypothetical protein
MWIGFSGEREAEWGFMWMMFLHSNLLCFESPEFPWGIPGAYKSSVAGREGGEGRAAL